MFEFFKRTGKNKQLESIIQSIQMNLSNNYKDNAQLDLKDFERVLGELEQTENISEAQKSYYKVKLSKFQEDMKNFTHKDQKTTW